MRIEDSIGARIKSAREARGLTLEVIGETVGRFLDHPWTPQAVWQAENGRRDFRVSHLLAFALALEVPLIWLLDAPDRGEDVTIGKTKKLTKAQLRALFPSTTTAAGEVDHLPLLNALTELRTIWDEDLRRLMAQLGTTREDLTAVRRRVFEVQQRVEAALDGPPTKRKGR